MDQELSQQSGSEEAVTTEPTQIVTDDIQSDDVAPPSGENDSKEGDADIPAYTPNFKYSVGNEEKEFAEQLREFVKSKEHEDMLRDLYTRADGLERVKSRRDEIEKQYNDLATQVGEVMRTVEKGDLKSAMNALGVDLSDFTKVAKALGYTKEDILKNAYQLASLTAEEEQYQNQLTEAERIQMELERERQQYQTQLQQLQVQNRKTELQSTLSSQEISGIVKTFDQLMGKEGAFEREVILRADHHHKLTGEDLPVQVAVEQVVRLARHMRAGEQPKAQLQKKDLPVIPAVGQGGTQSPVQKKPKSIEELKAFAATLSD